MSQVDFEALCGLKPGVAKVMFASGDEDLRNAMKKVAEVAGTLAAFDDDSASTKGGKKRKSNLGISQSAVTKLVIASLEKHVLESPGVVLTFEFADQRSLMLKT